MLSHAGANNMPDKPLLVLMLIATVFLLLCGDVYFVLRERSRPLTSLESRLRRGLFATLTGCLLALALAFIPGR